MKGQEFRNADYFILSGSVHVQRQADSQLLNDDRDRSAKYFQEMFRFKKKIM